MIKLKTPAKINLFLDVIEQEKNGFHKIVTLFQAINLFDEMEICESAKNEIYLNPEGIIKGDNIVNKIICQLKDRSITNKNFKIILNKNIPIGAGLGGGSSDAAATLIGIKKLLNLNISAKDINEILKSVGSDVIFFIDGGLQFGIHYGEMLEKLDVNFSYYIILVYPGFQISTKLMYNSLNGSYFQKGEKQLENIIESINKKNLDKLILNVYNIFESLVYKEYPILYQIKCELLNEGADNALLSGTGSTVYGIFRTRKKAITALNRLINRYEKVILTEPLNKGVQIIK